MATQRTFSEFMSICESVSQSDLRLAKSGVLSRHADALQREIDDVTSGKKPTTPKVKRKVAKISFIDRSNAKLREESEDVEMGVREEEIDYVGMSSGAKAASERAKAAKEAKRERQQSEAEAARREFRTKGVPFSDKKGSGHIVNGKKVYDS